MARCRLYCLAIFALCVVPLVFQDDLADAVQAGEPQGSHYEKSTPNFHLSIAMALVSEHQRQQTGTAGLYLRCVVSKGRTCRLQQVLSSHKRSPGAGGCLGCGATLQDQYGFYSTSGMGRLELH